MVDVDIDTDRWRLGRGPWGTYEVKLLKANYPYVKFDPLADWNKIRKILHENIEEDPQGLKPYLTYSDCVFFQDKEDAELVRVLRYIY